MQWEGREESENVEDRRSFGSTGVAVGGGGILILLIAMFLGVDPAQLGQFVGQGQPQPGQVQPDGPKDPVEEHDARFAKVIFHDTEVVWDNQFRLMGKQYVKPIMVLYSGQVDSACGTANSAVGPFYCPGDSKVYLDLSFFKDMQRKLNAPGDFARAYVIAHEVGHHVQRLLGYSQRVDEARQRMPKTEFNRMSVRLELQADFLAGVWAHHGEKKYKFLEHGDVETAMNAANQIGDDRLQRRAQGHVVPDAFTHGTSKQRMRWFMEGLQTGDVKRAADLFNLRYDDL